MADWIRYKLDQRIDHMLVDEAQDTNERQWDLVEAIVEEYFETEPDDDASGALRTLFVVGDTKQAIFGFQGTSPTRFRRRPAALSGQAQGAQATSSMNCRSALSFRSMPAVLDVVDATLAADRARRRWPAATARASSRRAQPSRASAAAAADERATRRHDDEEERGR